MSLFFKPKLNPEQIYHVLVRNGPNSCQICCCCCINVVNIVKRQCSLHRYEHDCTQSCYSTWSWTKTASLLKLSKRLRGVFSRRTVSPLPYTCSLGPGLRRNEDFCSPLTELCGIPNPLNGSQHVQHTAVTRSGQELQILFSFLSRPLSVRRP
jgi:hypothetical protein